MPDFPPLAFVNAYLDAADAFFTKSDSGNFDPVYVAYLVYDNNDVTYAAGEFPDDVIWVQFVAAYPIKLSGARVVFAAPARRGTAFVEYLNYAGVWIELASQYADFTMTWEPTWTPVLALAFRVRVVPDEAYYASLNEVDPRVVV